MYRHSDLGLWFGDERRYNATELFANSTNIWLWFGDERRYNATPMPASAQCMRCGLVMKEDIAQQPHCRYRVTDGDSEAVQGKPIGEQGDVGFFGTSCVSSHQERTCP